ncbi:hypothetical protein [Streptomyces sp. ME19-01-6]|uniref:hypothetical protein n=1 Tax=Streptomyces sp. ME19-01-6 TaxID=3028686 RepID=UPI0029A761CC|nr:hypothetical protein [Streptomyces sp. ME19-01-6]MDX3226137.1 hypothetical protein [Streptomyces sp. ME19-01-6]
MTKPLSSDEVHALLYELCVDLGFCLPPQDIRRLREAPPADVDEFTDAVFTAEGMEPRGEDDWLRVRVRDVVERHMRGERP